MISINEEILEFPFIIWTVQRTGGTNFANCLMQKSSFKTVEHEPFNQNRIYGSITNNWALHKDSDELSQNIIEIVRQRLNIKHCIEVVPHELSRALAKSSIQNGYRHIFLYRENPLDRLISLWVAKKTNNWGSNLKLNSQLTCSLDLPSIKNLLAHEKYCRKKMTQMWTYISKSGGEPFVITYEQLYKSSRPQVSQRIINLLDLLGLARTWEENETFIKILLKNSVNRDDKKYINISGVGGLAKELQQLDKFELKIPPPSLE